MWNRITRLTGRPRSVGVALAGVALVAAACSGSPSASVETPTLVVRLNPSQVSTAIAQDEGLYENLEVEYSLVGYGESAALFLANQDDIGFESPWEVARFLSEGEDISFFSTAGALNFWNGVIIRKEDAGTYTSIDDLIGKKLGQPGFGTGTWLAFEIIAEAVNGIDAQEEFELVEADPGALLGLLSTGEIDAALNFAGQAASAMASDEFELLYSFTETWREAEGQPLTINGMIGRRDFLEQNTDVVRRFIEGNDKAVQWMRDNPDELKPGGKYAEYTAGEGWHRDEATTELILSLLEAGTWYFTSELYTDAWVDASYKFIQQGEGVLAPEVPPKEEVFFLPSELNG